MSFKILSSLFFVLNCINAQEKSITTIKSRIYESIINDYFVTPSNSESKDFDQEIQTILSNFDGEKWSYIQYNDVSREGSDNRIHLNNLILMDVAYESSHSKYYLDKTLLKKSKMV